MSALRIVFMGSPDFAVPSLDLLHESDHEIVAVVSGSDKRRRRRGEPEPTPVKERAIGYGLKTIDADDMKSPELEKTLKTLNADLFVVVAFKILPKSLLKIPSKGSINLHASLLPKYRGAAPIHWAVINGEQTTGTSVFFLDEDVDTGKIIKQKPTPIGPNETTGDLYDRLKNEGAGLIAECVNLIATGKYNLTEQNEAEATPAPKLFNENTAIDFEKPSAEVHNLVRGLNPFPVAWCRYGDLKMNVYKTIIGPDIELDPGELSLVDEQLLAGCGTGTVELLQVQLPGRKRMSGLEFANGYKLEINLS